MKYSISVKMNVSMFKEAWHENHELKFDYDFTEDDFQILTENFTKFGPEDDIIESLEKNLPDVADNVYEMVAEVAKDKTHFAGAPKDLLEYLNECYNRSPMDIIEQDIKHGTFVPKTQTSASLSDDELISQWCAFRQQEFENIKYNTLSDFFQKEHGIYTDFIDSAEYEVRLSQDLYQAINDCKAF